MNKIPSPLVSLIPIAVLVTLLFATIRTFGSDAPLLCTFLTDFSTLSVL